MIRLIPGARASLFPSLIDAMFRCRAQTFHERLKWDVVVKNGYEQDVFDDHNPLYVVSADPVTEEYWASIRLLPTTGPNMLRDVFSCLLDDGEVIESATIWRGRVSARSAERVSQDAPEAASITLSQNCLLGSARLPRSLG